MLKERNRSKIARAIGAENLSSPDGSTTGKGDGSSLSCMKGRWLELLGFLPILRHHNTLASAVCGSLNSCIEDGFIRVSGSDWYKFVLSGT
jgi:hypothetical protein